MRYQEELHIRAKMEIHNFQKQSNQEVGSMSKTENVFAVSLIYAAARPEKESRFQDGREYLKILDRD